MLIAFGAADFAAIFYDGIAVANSAGSAAFYGADDNIQPCCTDRDGNGIPPFPKR